MTKLPGVQSRWGDTQAPLLDSLFLVVTPDGQIQLEALRQSAYRKFSANNACSPTLEITAYENDLLGSTKRFSFTLTDGIVASGGNRLSDKLITTNGA